MNKIRLNILQEKLYLDDCLKYPSSEYNEINFTFQISGDLSVSTLRETYRNIMLEYLPFSSTIQVVDNNLYFVHDSDNFAVPLHVLDSKDIIEYGSLDSAIETLAKRPFNLNCEFPCRFYCIKSGNDFFLLHLIHHIVLDGNTARLFFDRLSVIYNQLREHRYSPCPQTNDIICHTTSLEDLFSQSKEDNEKYWRQYISDTPISISMTQEASISGDDESSYSFPFTLSPALEQRLTSLCQSLHTTLFRIYSSAWAFALSKMFNTRELLLVHSLNMLPKDKAIYGTYINNLPIRFAFGDFESFLDLLTYSNENRDNERAHCHFHLSELFHQENNNGVLTPLNVGINYPLCLNSIQLEFQGCTTRLWKHVHMPLSTDIMLSIETDSVVSCEIRHNPKIDRKLIESLTQLFSYVLCQFADNPDIRLSDIRLVSPEKEKALTDIENSFLHKVEEPVSFLSRFKSVVNSFPQQPAVVYDSTSLSYSELYHKSRALALHLRSMNIVHSNVGLSIPKSADTIIGILGILMSGNTYVPFDSNNPKSRIRHIADDCRLSLVVVCDETEDCFETLPTINVKRIPDTDDTLALQPPSLDDTAYIIYTSGTTGMAKGIPISHRLLAYTIANNISLLNLNLSTRIMQYINVVFDASVVEIFPSLASGCTLYLPLDTERKDSQLLVSFLLRNNITLITLPAIMLSNLPHVDIPSLSYIIIGGDTTTKDALEFWSKGRTLINVYGPSENTVDTTYNIISAESCTNDIGMNMPGVTCYVLDDNLHLLPDYAIGELHIGGHKLTGGYLNLHDLNARKFVDNPYVSRQDRLAGNNTSLYKSGDIAARLPNGHLIFHGRSDFQVKINGFRIELGEIESKIKNYGHGISDAVAVVRDNDGIKTIVAYIQVTDPKSFNIDALRLYLTQNLQVYMLPAFIVPLKSFPYNTSGKVDRSKLPSPNENKDIEDYLVPVTFTEKILAKIWSDITKVDFIGRSDTFSSLGGDSISIIKLIYAIHERLGVNLSVTNIYQYASLSELASFIDSINKNSDNSTLHKLLRIARDMCHDESISADTQLFHGMTEAKIASFVYKAATAENLYFTTFDVKNAITIANLEKEVDKKIYFWSEGRYTDKPVIIFINGFVDYYPYNEPVVSCLEKHFSVFCIESFINHFLNKKEVTLDGLLQVYDDIISVALKDKEIFAITGYCVGAELSLALAAYMQEHHDGLKLQVLNIEGIYDRTLYNRLNIGAGYANSPERVRIFDSIYHSMPPLNYSGPVVHVMVNQPMDNLPNTDNAQEIKLYKKNLRRAWSENIENWRTHYPNSPLFFIDCSHMYFREQRNLKQFIAILKKHWKL